MNINEASRNTCAFRDLRRPRTPLLRSIRRSPISRPPRRTAFINTALLPSLKKVFVYVEWDVQEKAGEVSILSIDWISPSFGTRGQHGARVAPHDWKETLFTRFEPMSITSGAPFSVDPAVHSLFVLPFIQALFTFELGHPGNCRYSRLSRNVCKENKPIT